MSHDTTVMIKSGGLGDLLMLSPALRAWRKSFPEERIVFFVGKSNRGVMATNPHVDALEVFDDAVIFQGTRMEKLGETRAVIAAIRRHRPRRILVFHRDWRWNAMAWLAGGRERYGFRRDLDGRFLTHAIDSSMDEHEIEKYRKLCGQRERFRPDGNAMDLFPEEGDAAAVDALLKGWDERPLVAVSPGGAANVKEEMDLRRWPLARFRELMTALLAETEANLVLLGGPGDRRFTEALHIDANRVLDLAGRTRIPQTGEVLRRCAVLVTHDSGPMHIGAAAAIPVIGLFGPTHPAEKYPLTHPQSRYLWPGTELPCCPCYDNGVFPQCPIDKECMRMITVEAVLGTVREILSASGTGP